MKKIIHFFLVLLVAAGAVWFFGLYPVALVNGTPVFARAWRRTLDAEKRVINVRAYAEHAPLVDFSSPQNASLLALIRRNTLTFLIDSVLTRKEGRRVVPDLERLSAQRVNDEVTRNGLTDQTASAVYGLDMDTLKEAVLIPHARQEILDKTLAADGENFEKWLLDLRKQATVRFFSNSYSWTEEGVK